MTDLLEIHAQLFQANTPMRVVLKIPTTQLDASNYAASADDLVTSLFPDWKTKTDPRVLFLAMEIWGDRAFLAIDINNQAYNYETAHTTAAVLPVHVLWRHRRRGWMLVRWPQEDRSLAERLMYLHNANGWAPTPFVEDHNERVVHVNPREFRPTTSTCIDRAGSLEQE